MDLYDVRNKIRDLLEQDQFNSEGSGMSLVEPVADIEMTYLGGRYWITIRDMGEVQHIHSGDDDGTVQEKV